MGIKLLYLIEKLPRSASMVPHHVFESSAGRILFSFLQIRPNMEPPENQCKYCTIMLLHTIQKSPVKVLPWKANFEVEWIKDPLKVGIDGSSTARYSYCQGFRTRVSTVLE